MHLFRWICLTSLQQRLREISKSLDLGETPAVNWCDRVYLYRP
jgi:hypothetical protein